MPPLSPIASAILERMELDRSYGPDDLRAFAEGASVERLREIMHELWVNRRVERVGYAGWRRQHSAVVETPVPASHDVQTVRPDELFDHAAFSDFFK